jgi:hypothetical protein
VSDRPDEQLPCEDADDDRRQAIENVGEKPDRGGELAAAVLRQIKARAHTNGQSDQACHPYED